MSFPHFAMWILWKTCLSEGENHGISPSFVAFSEKVIHNTHKFRCGKLFFTRPSRVAKMRESERKNPVIFSVFPTASPPLLAAHENIHPKKYEPRAVGRRKIHARTNREKNKIPTGEATPLRHRVRRAPESRAEDCRLHDEGPSSRPRGRGERKDDGARPPRRLSHQVRQRLF